MFTRLLATAATALVVALPTIGTAHAATSKPVPLESAPKVLTSLLDEFTDNTRGVPMQAASGSTRVYLGPNGATQTTSAGTVEETCLPVGTDRVRCWTRDGNTWRASVGPAPESRYENTAVALGVNSIDSVIDSMENYGALTTVTRTDDEGTTTIVMSSMIVHPITGEGIELERHEFTFTPTTARYVKTLDNSVKVTTSTETIKPTERTTITAP